MAVKTFVVTGASRGLGLAISHYLLKESHNVTVLARSEAPLRELQHRYPQQVRILAGDLSDFSLAQKAVDLTRKEFGRLDGLVISHGILPPVTHVGGSDVEAWKHHFDVNFFSGVAFTKAALPLLRHCNGRIIFISSGAAVASYASWGAYGASKAALNHLAMTLSIEEPEVITISIRPGVVDTQMQQELRDTYASYMHEKDAAKFLGLHKEGKLLSPEKPGNVIAKLVLDGPKKLSGRFLSWNDEELEDFQEP